MTIRIKHEGIAKVEVHLIDHLETIYGQPLEVEFLERLRDIVAFENEAQLIKQLKKDVARSRQIALSAE